MIDIKEIDTREIFGIVKKVPIISDHLIVEILVIEKGEDTATHIHKSSDEVQYVIKGTGFITVDGKDHPLREGISIMVPKNMSHKFASDNGQLTIMSVRNNPTAEFNESSEAINVPQPA
jgi:mannose-6-phosphate isomerase-like protein (cupin superfamily)